MLLTLYQRPVRLINSFAYILQYTLENSLGNFFCANNSNIFLRGVSY
jgi:hypothetical protein